MSKVCFAVAFFFAMTVVGHRTGLRFYFLEKNFFSKFELQSLGCGLSASAAYAPVFTVPEERRVSAL